MSTETLEKIKKFAKDAKAPKGPKEDFLPPTAADLRAGDLFCFDQTVGSTGWCQLVVHGDSVVVPASGVIHPSEAIDAKGPEWSLRRSPDLFEAVHGLLLRQAPRTVVIEMPIAHGFRTDSSLVAANVICCVLRILGWDEPVVMARQAAATAWCGYPNASKKATGMTVDRLLTQAPPRPWNEHTRDAAVLGLTHLLEARA